MPPGRIAKFGLGIQYIIGKAHSYKGDSVSRRLALLLYGGVQGHAPGIYDVFSCIPRLLENKFGQPFQPVI